MEKKWKIATTSQNKTWMELLRWGIKNSEGPLNEGLGKKKSRNLPPQL
jgi:hypothetical protein